MTYFCFIKWKKKRNIKKCQIIKKRKRKKDKAVPVMTNNLYVRLELDLWPAPDLWPATTPPCPACSPNPCRLQWQTPSSTSPPHTCDLSVHTGKKWLSLFQDYVGSREGTQLGQPVLEWISQGQQKCQRWCLIWRVLYNARMMDSKRLGQRVFGLAGGSSLRDKCCCLMRVKRTRGKGKGAIVRPPQSQEINKGLTLLSMVSKTSR